MNEKQLKVLRVQGHDCATICAEDGEPLQLLRFDIGSGDYSPWIALSVQQHSTLLQDMTTHQTAAIEYDYSR